MLSHCDFSCMRASRQNPNVLSSPYRVTEQVKEKKLPSSEKKPPDGRKKGAVVNGGQVTWGLLRFLLLFLLLSVGAVFCCFLLLLCTVLFSADRPFFSVRLFFGSGIGGHRYDGDDMSASIYRGACSSVNNCAHSIRGISLLITQELFYPPY